MRHYSDRERQPFLGGPGDKSKPRRRAVDVLVVLLLPWLVFTLIVCLFVFASREFAPLVWSLVVASVLLSVLFMMVGNATERPAQLLLGLLIMASVAVAIPVGLFLESGFMTEFWRLDHGAAYRFLDPMDPGASHTDGTVLDFVPGTSVDTQRAVGYLKHGTLYCVAPIVGPEGETKAEYWATGKDCCSYRGHFDCGDVDDKEARSGVKVTDESGNYMSAARMAGSLYDLGAPGRADSTLFLYWTSNADKYKDSLWASATILLIVASSMHLFVSLCAGYCFTRAIP